MCGFFPNQKICGILKIFLEYSEADGGLADRFFYFRLWSKTLSSHETFFHFFRRKVEKQKMCLKNPNFWGRKKKEVQGLESTRGVFTTKPPLFHSKTAWIGVPLFPAGPNAGKNTEKQGQRLTKQFWGGKCEDFSRSNVPKNHSSEIFF